MFSNIFPVANGPFARPSEYLYAALDMPPVYSDVTLQYSSATRNYVWTLIYDRYWARWKFDVLASGLWRFGGFDYYDVIAAWPDTDASITWGGVWSTGTPSAALNATWHYSKTLNRTATFDVTGADRIYVVVSALTNGGYANVTINGGTALVNELPLVGGNRQLNCYASPNAYNTRIPIASGLDPTQTYTVVITVTNTKQAESSDTYVYLEGYGIFTLTVNSAQVWATLYGAKNLLVMGFLGGESECAIDYKPTGASLHEWTGSGHLNEVITSVKWLDPVGNDMAVSVGTPRTNAAGLVLTQTGTTRHGETGATDHANLTYIHTFNSKGMTIYHKHAWLSAANIRYAYPAMMSFNPAMNRGHVAGDNQQIYNLATNDGAYCGQKRERLAAIWDTTHNFVGWLYIPSLTSVNSWLNSDYGMFIDDRADNLINKIYCQRVGLSQPVNVIVGDIWESTAYYRISYIANPSTAINWV